MKNKYLSLLILITLCSQLSAKSMWAASVAGKGRDTVTSVAANKEMTCYTGNTQGGHLQFSGMSNDKNATIKSFEMEEVGQSAVLTCTALNGELLHINALKGAGIVQINDITITPSGAIYLAGFFATQMDMPKKLESNHSEHQTVKGVSGIDGFVAKYAEDKSLQWVKTLSNDTGTQAWQLEHLQNDQQGVVVQGLFHANLKLPSGETLTGKAAKNHYLVGFNGQGDVLWSHQWSSENGKTVIGGLAIDEHSIYESFVHEMLTDKGKKKSTVMVVARDKMKGSVRWQQEFQVKGSGYVTAPIVNNEHQVTVGISFHNKIYNKDFGQEFVSSGQTDAILVSMNEIDGKVMDEFKFGEAGSEMLVALSYEPQNDNIIFSYYQILADQQKVHYHTASYSRDRHGKKTLPIAKLLSRDHSIQAQYLIDDKLITAGVLFRNKGQSYTQKDKLTSVKKSDMYVNVYKVL